MTDHPAAPAAATGLERHTFDAMKMAAAVGLVSWAYNVAMLSPLGLSATLVLVGLGAGAEAGVAALLAWYAVVYLAPRLSFTWRVVAFFPAFVVILGLVMAVTGAAFTMDWSDPLNTLNIMAIGTLFTLGMKMPGLILGTAAGVWWLHRSRRKRESREQPQG